MTHQKTGSEHRSVYTLSYIIIAFFLFGAVMSGFATSPTHCAISPGASYNYPVCTSASGSITMAPTGGRAPYTYRWSSGQTTGTLTNLPVGSYTVTITDASECTVSRTFNMTAYMRVMNLSTSEAGDTCAAGIGRATVTVVSNGVSPYQYSWTNGATTATASHLAAGTYTATVTDYNGCTASASATVGNIGTPIIANGTVSQPICPNTGGTISVSPSGGTSSIYRVAWSNGSNGDTVKNLAAGSYTATVYGQNGCVSSASYAVNAPPAAISANATSTAPLCYGGKGYISISPSGGTGPLYTAAWSNGENGMTDTAIVAGNYTVTITDQNNCSSSQVLTLARGPIINATANITQPVCTSANGSIQMTPSNGRAPYTYVWASGDTTYTIRDLAVGSYNVTVTDANSCTAAQTFSVTAYMRPLTLSTRTTPDTCGSGKGAASVAVTSNASVAPFTYAWANSQTTSSISGLTPGPYVVSVTDANGCENSITASVGNFISTISISGSISSPICTNPNGTITLTSVTGGKAPYSYRWNTGSTASSISGMAAGTYTVTVTDANSCTGSKSFTLYTYYTRISSAASSIGDTCSAHIGQASVSVTGGTGPMSYAWSNQATTATVTGLGAHYYTVTVTDINGCSTTAGTSVNDLGTAISITGTVTQPVCPNDSGAIAITVSGGTSSSYGLIWNNGSTAYSQNGLAAGTYSVNVSGTNGCRASQSYTITLPSPISLQYAVSPVKCDSAMGGTITETQMTGAVYPWSISWTGPTGFTSSSIDLDHLNAGDYSYSFTDSKGCTAQGRYTINKTGQLSASYLVTNTTCPGVNNGSIQRQSLAPYSSPVFQWTGPNSFTSDSTSIKNLAPGVYTLVISEGYGCSLTTTDTVYSGPAVSLIYATTPVHCDTPIGGTLINTGAINTNYPWNMSWTGPYGFTSNQTNFYGIAGGVYTVHFTDSRGCSNTQSFTVDSFGGIAANFNTSPITCLGARNGAVSYGSLAPYSSQATYSWSGPTGYTASGKNISGLAPGTYIVTVSENFGCKVSDTFNLEQMFDVGVASIKNINCPAPGMHMIIHPIAGDLSQLSGDHCASGVSGQVIMIVTGDVQYQGVDSGALVPDTIRGDTLIWNIADFGTLRIDSSFFIKYHVNTTAALGSRICVDVMVTPTAGDYNPGNNDKNYCMNVIRAYDPNSKDVYPEGNISTSQKDLIYTIQYQNIGTGPAQNIYILDTLDGSIDPASCEIWASSFPAQIYRTGNAIRFNINDIQLPPASQDSIGSRGWVQYHVKLSKSLAVGTIITNTANIYFDYNAPITTNTTITTVAETTTGIAGEASTKNAPVLYPDPAHDELFVKSDMSLAGGRLEIYDATGRLCRSILITDSNAAVDIRNLTAGVYMVNIISAAGTSTVKKLVVE